MKYIFFKVELFSDFTVYLICLFLDVMVLSEKYINVIFQRNYFQLTDEGQNFLLIWMDYKFKHVLGKGCLGFLLYTYL